MKRKLDQNDVPVENVSGNMPSDNAETFSALALETRLLQAVSKENFIKPTLVQAKSIPLALDGKDIIARAKTGSGKTAAYLLPVLHSILKKNATLSSTKTIAALILVPTRELAQQVYKAVEALTAFCAQDVRSVNLTQHISDAVHRSILADTPDIVIATPARASVNINSGALPLQSLTHLVVDEADLLLSYGYREDLQVVADAIPKGVQTLMMSATLTEDVDTLKVLFCRDPEVLTLEEPEEEGKGVSQFVVRCDEDEKFLLIYVIFKLKLIQGKCIIFVGDIDRCYRLKLFLEQFGIRSCILNSELPVNSRLHVVEEFNKNVYDIIIATDENEIVGAEERNGRSLDKDKSEAADTIPPGTADSGAKSAPTKRPRRSHKDKDYGISRGIDFTNVACVLNFDLPPSANAYTHRIGRTARAGQTGMALSFVIPTDRFRRHKPTSFPGAQHDERVLASIVSEQESRHKTVKPYHFDMAQVEAFRYRMDDALRAVTRVAVREARTRELRQELLKSEKLKRHFEENPSDLHHLRHDGELHAARVQAHLKHVPDYLLPREGKGGLTADNKDVGFVGIRKTRENRIRHARSVNRAKGRGAAKKAGPGRKSVDPLKTFKAGRK